MNYSIINLVANHRHTVGGFNTDTKLIRISKTQTERIDFKIPEKNTELSNNVGDLRTLTALSQQTLMRITSLTSKLEEHLSKNQFLN